MADTLECFRKVIAVITKTRKKMLHKKMIRMTKKQKIWLAVRVIVGLFVMMKSKRRRMLTKAKLTNWRALERKYLK